MSYNDTIYIQSADETPEIAKNFCQQVFDNYETKVRDTHSQKRTTVYKDHFSIGIFPFNPPDSMKRTARDDYGFVPNRNMPIFYSKSKAVWVKNNGNWDLPLLRDVILKGVIGLIKTTNYSIALAFDNPRRDVLIYHAGELTLLEDPCWTEERLLLFKDIPYTFRNE